MIKVMDGEELRARGCGARGAESRLESEDAKGNKKSGAHKVLPSLPTDHHDTGRAGRVVRHA
jgi:hypothetical protein